MKSKYEPCSICEKYIEGVICDEYKCPVRKMKDENDRLINYNENLLAANVGLSCSMLDEIKTAKSEAIKEFAEELCEGRVSNDPVVIAVRCAVKEMTEGTI